MSLPATTVTLQAAAPFGALAVEDEAHEAPVLALGDLVEADRPAALEVGAHDRADARDRRAALGGRQPELDLLADLQRARPRKQHPAAAEVHGVGLDRAPLTPGDDQHRPGGLDAHVLALLDQLDRVQLAEAQQLAALQRDRALQPD